jgi:hypothetical protein
LRQIKTVVQPNGVTVERKQISTMGLTRALSEVIRLNLPLKSAEELINNIQKLEKKENLNTNLKNTTTTTSTTTINANAKKTLKKKKIVVSAIACEKYFRRVRCEHRIPFNKWDQSKNSTIEKEMKKLKNTVKKCLNGDITSLQLLLKDATILEKNARLVLGEDPKAIADTMGESDLEGGSHNTTKSSRTTTRVQKELKRHNILPKWQVDLEAEKITSHWLVSLEGRAAVRHHAWATVNKGKPMDAAVEPDQPALIEASAELKRQRLKKLLSEENDNSNPNNVDDHSSPFYEMLSHKLFGEYLRETLLSVAEWKKSSMSKSGKFPKRSFHEWLERRAEQEKRNRETVEQWRKHKRRQLGLKQKKTRRVASVDSVLEQMVLLEQAGYLEVPEKGGSGKMRKCARHGIHYLEIRNRIKEIGLCNAMEVRNKIKETTTKKRIHPISAAPIEGTTGQWISFQQFLTIMETNLFSLKAHPATVAMADALLLGNILDVSGTKQIPLFVEDTEISKIGGEKMMSERIERKEVYSKWKAAKDEENRIMLHKVTKRKENLIKKKLAIQKKSKKAVQIWEKKLATRKKSKKFIQKVAWEDVITPMNKRDEDDEFNDM